MHSKRAPLHEWPPLALSLYDCVQIALLLQDSRLVRHGVPLSLEVDRALALLSTDLALAVNTYRQCTSGPATHPSHERWRSGVDLSSPSPEDRVQSAAAPLWLRKVAHAMHEPGSAEQAPLDAAEHSEGARYPYLHNGHTAQRCLPGQMRC